MTSRIPDIHEVSQALWYEPEETGFRDLGEWFASFRTEKAKDLHKIDVWEEWSIATVRELVKFRIGSLERSLELNQIELRNLWSGEKLKVKSARKI